MSAIISFAPGHYAPPARPLRFGTESAAEGGSVQWLLRRNCSLAPVQLLAFYASLCLVSLAIAAICWRQGATLVMPFAGVELLAVGSALLAYARHAADRETILLQGAALTVERISGSRTERVVFAPDWVRVEPKSSDRSLIELSGQGRRVSIGRYVRPELRRPLADELRWALRRWQVRRPVAADADADARKNS
jgi:uncharacterized membrane protein